MINHKHYLWAIIFLFACRNQANNVNSNNYKFSEKDRFLIKEILDSTGALKSSQSFNKDTIPDGPAIEYYRNGIIRSWQWFGPKFKDPYASISYSEKGIFDTLVGDGFLDLVCCNEDNHVVIKLINPPQVSIRLLYKESVNSEITDEIMYKPIQTDTADWIILDAYKYNQKHKYKLYFYIVDTVTKTLFYQDSIEIKGGGSTELLFSKQ